MVNSTFQKTELGVSLDRTLEIYSVFAFIVRASISRSALLWERPEQSVAEWSEWMLQALWNEGWLRELPQLYTEDGRTVEIVHPGTWNSEAGPDFLDAVLRFDGVVFRGPIEMHRVPGDWHVHGHDEDVRYSDVIMHVVWENNQKKASSKLPPCLAMKEYLSSGWLKLLEDIAAEGYPYSRRIAPGQCALQTAELDDSVIRDFLTGAGLARFQQKSRALLDRSLAAGFEQTAYEALSESMGYKANREPFRELARYLSLAVLGEIKEPLTRLAGLLGGAGFLTDPTRQAKKMSSSRQNMNRELWYRWWCLGLQPLNLKWKRHGVRPVNRPEKRLMAVWRLLEKWRYRPLARWEQVLSVDLSPASLAGKLKSLFGFTNSAEFNRLLELTGVQTAPLGEKRILDIGVNLLLPLLHARACQENDVFRQDWCEAAFLHLPRLQGNQITQRVVHRLLVPASRQQEIIQTAAQQQGLLAINRDFCQHLNGNCRFCPLNNRQMFEKILDGN